MSKIKYGVGAAGGLIIGSISASLILLLYKASKYGVFQSQKVLELLRLYPECHYGIISIKGNGLGGQAVYGILCPHDEVLQNSLNKQVNQWAEMQANKDLKAHWPVVFFPAMIIILLLTVGCCFFYKSNSQPPVVTTAALPDENSANNQNTNENNNAYIERMFQWFRADGTETQALLEDDRNYPKSPKNGLNH